MHVIFLLERQWLACGELSELLARHPLVILLATQYRVLMRERDPPKEDVEKPYPQMKGTHGDVFLPEKQG